MKPLFFAATFAIFSTSGVLLESKYNVSEVRKTTVQIEMSKALIEMSVMQNGEEMPEMPGMEQEQSTAMTGTIIDRTIAVDGTNQTSFERKYEDLVLAHSASMTHPMAGEQSNEGEASSELNDKRVVFELKDGEFAARFPDDVEGDDELLEQLDAELPWALFLGDGEHAVDDQWEIEPHAIWRVINLGGELSFQDESGGGSEPSIPFDEIEFEGTVTATLASIDDADGASHASIMLAVELTVVQDLTEMMANQEMPEDAPAGMMMPDIESMINETTYTSEAALTWNVTTGSMVNFQMEYEFEESTIMELAIEMGSEMMQIEQTMVSEGEGIVAISQEIERE